MHILKPQLSDLPQIKNILSQWTNPQETQTYLDYVKAEIQSQPQFHQQFFIAKDHHQVLGIIGLTDVLPQTLPFAKTTNFTELKFLYVDGNTHGQGVGSGLLNFVENIAKKNYDEILVRSANRYQPNAQTFYEKMGYEKVGFINKEKPMTVFSKVFS